jgi:hypothetical protein
MAILPKVDSVGLRLAKSAGAERVSSVVRVTKDDDKKSGGGHSPAVRNGSVNGDHALQPAGGRKASR